MDVAAGLAAGARVDVVALEGGTVEHAGLGWTVLDGDCEEGLRGVLGFAGMQEKRLGVGL